MHAAGIVPDHAAERATAVACRIGAESQVVFLGGASQMVENDSGLNPRGSALRIKRKNFRHIFGEIEHDGHIAALPGKRSSSTAAKDRRTVLPRDRHRGDHIVRVAGNDHSDRNLAVVGAVGSVEGAAAVVEANFAAEMAAQSRFQGFSVKMRMFC